MGSHPRHSFFSLYPRKKKISIFEYFFLPLVPLCLQWFLWKENINVNLQRLWISDIRKIESIEDSSLHISHSNNIFYSTNWNISLRGHNSWETTTPKNPKMLKKSQTQIDILNTVKTLYFLMSAYMSYLSTQRASCLVFFPIRKSKVNAWHFHSPKQWSRDSTYHLLHSTRITKVIDRKFKAEKNRYSLKQYVSRKQL